MLIKWENYIWQESNTDGLNDIPSIENKLGIKFPEDYLNVVTKNQGKTPEPCIFKIGEKSINVFNTLYHFSSKDKTYNLLHRYDFLKEIVSDRIIPFGDTPNDDSLCFDYRDNSVNPKIVLVIHELSGEKAIRSVANNFTDFLEILYEDDE